MAALIGNRASLVLRSAGIIASPLGPDVRPPARRRQDSNTCETHDVAPQDQVDLVVAALVAVVVVVVIVPFEGHNVH